MLKKLTFLPSLLMLVVSGVFWSCDDENDDGNISKTTYEFSVDEAHNPIVAPAEGGEFTILVTSTKTAQAGTTNVAYTIVSTPEWAEAQLEQTALVVRVAQNSATTDRETGVILLQQEESENTLEIQVKQSGFANSMTLEETFSVARCKVLNIEPQIEGFDQEPTYEWKLKTPSDAEAQVVSTDKTLQFIQLETGEYEVTFTITDLSQITLSATSKVTVTSEETPYSPFIAEVLEYRPAVLDSRVPFAPIDNQEVAQRKVSDKLVGADFSEFNQSSAPLGSLGGYIIFKFDHTVMNVKDLCDFRIGSGIGVQARPCPGVVYVAFDKNQNGTPEEDEWYELAGSEYNSAKVRRDVKIVYERPASYPTMQDAQEIPEYLKWTINDSEKGSMDVGMQMIMWGGVPQWPYWLREVDEGLTMTFEGVEQLPATISVNDMGMTEETIFYKYGYACNSNPRNETKSSFDIDWAVDKEGNPVSLPGIDFVKVQTGAMQLVGNYGISGTIINSAIDLHLKGVQITKQAAMDEENN